MEDDWDRAELVEVAKELVDAEGPVAAAGPRVGNVDEAGDDIAS